MGVGRVQRVFGALAGIRDLRIHSGAITTPLLRLAAASGLAGRADAITAGVALGSDALYRFVRDDPRVRFAPVGWTHDIATLAAIPRFVAVNSVIEVDLLGQANAEMIGGRQVGAAGRPCRLHARHAPPGGRAVVALPATAKGGTVSKIVAALPAHCGVGVARGDMDGVDRVRRRRPARSRCGRPRAGADRHRCSRLPRRAGTRLGGAPQADVSGSPQRIS
ncbi:MAG: hypothetical protein IPK78_19720 [Rhodospirillales bacterium]|nr:hypothetical protein [Rhodospirillales bacterium]